ncbi:MAG: VTT domain-containing protein [Candidatus Omnitrophica bacterium]|nr:VTT domain-containing protein [Candidatus Omnitrophota bacterium]
MSGNKIKFIFFIAVVVLLAAAGSFFRIDIRQLQMALSKFPVLAAGMIFVALYVSVTFFIWLSKDVFRITAALIFGPFLSTVFVFAAEIINAFILFNFSRILGRSFIKERLKGHLKNLDERLAQSNFAWLFIFRAVPLIPFRFMDLAAGLTKIPLRRYLIVAALGSVPRIFWLQYILSVAGKSLLTKPTATVDYLVLNKPALIFTLVYLVLVIAVLIKLRIKNS